MKKKRLGLLILFLLLVNGVFAQPDIELNSFREPGDFGSVTPPLIPLQSNNTNNSSREDIYSYLELKDISTGNTINNIHVIISIEDHLTAEEFKTIKYVGEDGLLPLSLENGTYTLTLKVDKLGTPGNDYINSFDVEVEGRFYDTIFMLPVGSVRGIVYDQNGNAVSSANIQFDCSTAYGETHPIITDSFGSFSGSWLPVGSCKISAAYNGNVGYQFVNITHGSLKDIEIVLSKSLVTQVNNSFWYIVYVVLGLLILYGAHFAVSKKRKRIDEEVKDIEDEKKLSKRSEDILKTLSDRERDIVHFLLESNNQSTQAKVRYSTGIPKTSLSRILDSLAAKKVVSIEKIGKMKKIRLTGWFLGKD
ncbi:hypothetical protein D6745_04505 [Candidatus Woesearchaeota archaeon]|nr:MAG: hypothetical protein D6745_04505 [Candidatus Woesearchaeota archaeon]